jgi:hypothetical protein
MSMNKINPFFLATGLVFLVCGYAWAGGSIEFLGGFSGGTVGAPVVLTGDNANGTGTLRIRPSDEDTQLVLCEAGNNASPEVCGTVHHVNVSSTVSFTEMGSNSYVDSAGAYQRYNTSFGAGTLFSQVSSTNSSNALGGTLWSTNNTVSGNWQLAVTGAGTSTFATGTVGTVTNDFRGKITNGGSAACNGINAGAVCVNDSDLHLYGSGNTSIQVQTSSASSVAYLGMVNSSGTVTANFGFANASFSDADLAGKAYWSGVSTELVTARSDDVAAGSVVTRWMDNYAASGVTLMDLLGNGTVRPLLYGSQTDCTDNAGAAACGAAPTGSVVLDDGSTTVVVSTTAVTANSTISVNFDPSLGTKLGITCNTTQTFPYVSARTAGTSFTITSADPAGTDKVCVSYSIIN